LLLATTERKQAELIDRLHQFERQLERASAAAVRSGSIEASLNTMSEVQERLDDAQRTRGHLDAIRGKVVDELQALELTRRVEEAKDMLQTLRERRKSEGTSVERREEIEQLERFVEEASIRAGQAITGDLKSTDR
jgi:hypothetical protein